VRGSQQVEETAADSLVFLYFSFQPHSCFCLYRRSLVPCVIDQGVSVLLDRHLLFTFRLALRADRTLALQSTPVSSNWSSSFRAYYRHIARSGGGEVLLHPHTHHSKFTFLPAHHHLSLVHRHHRHQVICQSLLYSQPLL
jgi:hypothetical protein